MLKDYLKNRNISVYSLSKNTDIPYSTLSDLCNGKVEIENCKVDILYRISRYLNLNMNEVYDICKDKDDSFYVERYDTGGKIFVRNKTYYVRFIYDDKEVVREVCKVTSRRNLAIKEIASWIAEDYITEKKMEELYNLRIKEFNTDVE
ncbi:MAG: helix-turn-helix transcriptional regulator [Erysipelotrichaceae bacterium]|nr:helix-turn-helix transcriptional regulator [Erysipelotrichaceae bacterium]